MAITNVAAVPTTNKEELLSLTIRLENNLRKRNANKGGGNKELDKKDQGSLLGRSRGLERRGVRNLLYRASRDRKKDKSSKNNAGGTL